jgi:uncharacterized metal-binding protein
MAMQTDVLASVPLTADGQFTNQTPANLGRTRVKAVYIVPAATAGSVVFKDGGASGATVMTLNTVASATQPTYLIFPGEGVLFSTNVYGDVTSIGSVTIFYG